MNLIKTISLLLLTFLISITIFGQKRNPTNYLGNVSTILFDKVAYNLAWASHPTENYYKQEYLEQGDTIESFKKHIILEVITGKTKLNDVVSAKVAELKKMKELNSVVNYKVYVKTKEVIIYFLVSADTLDGKYISIVERNFYRYKSIKEKNGQKCVLLFGVRKKGYGDDIDNSSQKLKENKIKLINLVRQFQIPEITIKR